MPKVMVVYGTRPEAIKLVTVISALAAAPDVEAIAFHTLLAQRVADGDIESGYGVLRADLSRKPAYCALARERGRTGCP